MKRNRMRSKWVLGFLLIVVSLSFGLSRVPPEDASAKGQLTQVATPGVTEGAGGGTLTIAISANPFRLDTFTEAAPCPAKR